MTTTVAERGRSVGWLVLVIGSAVLLVTPAHVAAQPTAPPANVAAVPVAATTSSAAAPTAPSDDDQLAIARRLETFLLSVRHRQ